MGNKNLTTKAVALIGLIAIAVSILGTGLLVILSPNQTQAPEMTQEQLEELLKSYSGSIETQTGELLEEESTGAINTGVVNE